MHKTGHCILAREGNNIIFGNSKVGVQREQKHSATQDGTRKEREEGGDDEGVVIVANVQTESSL